VALALDCANTELDKQDVVLIDKLVTTCRVFKRTGYATLPTAMLPPL
jgi:hypothetical protein